MIGSDHESSKTPSKSCQIAHGKGTWTNFLGQGTSDGLHGGPGKFILFFLRLTFYFGGEGVCCPNVYMATA